jgi:signal transduction histidine kinase
VEVSRIDAGELDLRLERIDLRRVTREVVEQLDHHDGHELSLELPDVPIEVECDPLRFEQIVTNLVSNAQKYSSPGTAVQVALERTERGAVLRVSDRGIGIAPEEQAAIFEPFRRARETTRGVAGSGLGLFVVKRLVEAHGGSIWLESTPGAGSTFRVLLPWKVD